MVCIYSLWYVFIHYLSFVLVMTLIAYYVLYWETFLRTWISFFFHVSTSSYECRARCITLEPETERLHIHTYLRTVITSERKETKTFSFFIRGVARILMGQGRLTKRGHKLWKLPLKCLQNWLYCLGFWPLKGYWVQFKSKIFKNQGITFKKI